MQEGREPLTYCDMCRMHMMEGRLPINGRMACCFKNKETRLLQRDLEVASWFEEMDLSLNRKEGEETIEGVTLIKFLGRTLEQSDDDLTTD